MRLMDKWEVGGCLCEPVKERVRMKNRFYPEQKEEELQKSTKVKERDWKIKIVCVRDIEAKLSLSHTVPWQRRGGKIEATSKR